MDNIEILIERLSGRIDALLSEREALLSERDGLRAEVARLTLYSAERDEENVRIKQEMARAFEAADEETSRAEHSETEIEAKLRELNDRLISLVMDQHQQPVACG